MWKLSSADESAPGQSYPLLVGVEYVVGRKNCAILIQADQSISRSHAVLSVSHPQMNLSQSSALPVLTLKDTSKYGTFVNEEKLPNGSTRTLRSGDRVTFGVFGSKYRIFYEPLVVCSSCLTVSQKDALSKNILQLGGHVVNEWKEGCTHLVMDSVKLTVKAICALIRGQTIVKPEYFDELIKAIQAKQQLPKHESFYPPIDELCVKNKKIDLAASPIRRTIFRGKTFVFLTAKQFAKLSAAVKLGGGEAKLITEEAEIVSSLAAPDICVIEVGLTNSQGSISDFDRKWMDRITAVFQRKQCRTISEAEIGLAVIFSSTKTYCNPQTPLDAGVKPTPAPLVTGPNLSQSVVVDETVMPTIAAYVDDTEMDQLMDTCMQVLGEKKEKATTPVREQRKRPYPPDITTVNETPAGTGALNVGATLPILNARPETNQSSLLPSPSKMSGNRRNKDGDSQQQLNSIKNYFQPVNKKRERDEVEETSQCKYAKIEEKSSLASSHTQPVASLLWESRAGGSQKGSSTLDQNTNKSCIGGSRKAIAETSRLEENNTENIIASKKRKELEDSIEDEASLELVFASQELDWEDDTGNHGECSAQGAKKKRKLEIKEVNSDMEAGGLQQEKKQSLPVLNQKQEREELPGSAKNDSNNPDRSANDSSNLPSRLLLTEFRSLVVSKPRKDGHCTAKIDYGHRKNFKKFKKVAYPGAGQLPYIIGGSDLIAHHTRKNSEMEEWLRQEMEEQSRQAKEESLADDLFRYDPHVKRR